MSYKTFLQISILTTLIAALIAIPGRAGAGGVCGGTYIAESGDTVEKVASKCGTTASAIYSANPGISSNLSIGQSLFVPGSNYGNPPPTAYIPPYTPTPYVYYPPAKPISYTGYYLVQPGDTFSGIASRYGVSIYDLWVYNPYIWDINVIYVGQAIYIPTSSSTVIVNPYPYPTQEAVPLSYGEVPINAPKGRVTLSNQANGDVYISLQGTTTDGAHVIREYPVNGSITEKIPAAWYSYVAWVGGKKFQGEFHLGGDSEYTIIFYEKKVVVQ